MPQILLHIIDFFESEFFLPIYLITFTVFKVLNFFVNKVPQKKYYMCIIYAIENINILIHFPIK